MKLVVRKPGVGGALAPGSRERGRGVPKGEFWSLCSCWDGGRPRPEGGWIEGGAGTLLWPLLQDLPGPECGGAFGEHRARAGEGHTHAGAGSRERSGQTPPRGRRTAETKGRPPAAPTPVETKGRPPAAHPTAGAGRSANRRAAAPPPERGGQSDPGRGRGVRPQPVSGEDGPGADPRGDSNRRGGRGAARGACGGRGGLSGECGPGARRRFRSHGTGRGGRAPDRTGAHAGPSGGCKTQTGELGGLRGWSAPGPREFAKGRQTRPRPREVGEGRSCLPACGREPKGGWMEDGRGGHWQTGTTGLAERPVYPPPSSAPLTSLPGCTFLPAPTAARGLHTQPRLPCIRGARGG